MKLSNKSLLLASVISILIDNSTAVLAENGYDSTGDHNKFLANGTQVMTLTGSTQQADFSGAITAGGGLAVAGSAVFGGKLGIGTTTPAHQLDVEDTIGHSVIRVGSPSAYDSTLQLYSSDVAAVDATGKSTTTYTGWALLKNRDNGNFMINRDSAPDFGSFTAMSIMPSGNVGIGTTTPQATLDVNGTIKSGSGTIGATCSAEGALAYDPNAHVPVYCSNSMNWEGQSGNKVTIYTKTGNIGIHSFCALGQVQNGWNSSIGNHWTYVERNSDGSWTSSSTSDRSPYVVCLDIHGTTTTTNTTTTTSNIANVSCPAGKVLAGLSDGQPVCTTSNPAPNIVPSGTLCGSSADDHVYGLDTNLHKCQGHNPRVDCPTGYTSQKIFQADSDLMYSCVAD